MSVFYVNKFRSSGLQVTDVDAQVLLPFRVQEPGLINRFELN